MEPRVTQTVEEGNVISVEISGEGVSEAITVSDDSVSIQLPEGIEYEEFSEEFEGGVKTTAGLLRMERSTHDQAVDRWREVYDDCNARGKIVLRTLAIEGKRTGDELLVEYSELKTALEENGYDVSSQTFAGIFRGVNASIAGAFPDMSEASDAQDILTQTRRDDGSKYRVLKSSDTGNHPKALSEALSRIGAIKTSR